MKLIASLLLATTCLGFADWPEFRGENGSGVAEKEKPPVHLDIQTNLQWKVALPHGMSSPVIWGDRIFLTGFEDNQLKTLCLDRKSGKVLWSKVAPAKEIEAYYKPDGSPASSTPATDGTNVYVYFG